MTTTIEKPAENDESGAATKVRRGWLRAVSQRMTRRAGRLPKTVRITILAVLSVLAVLLAGTGMYLYLQARSHDETGAAEAAALASARTEVPALLSYDYKAVDKNLADAGAQTTGDFKQQFTTLSQQVIAPAAKDQQIVTNATVAGAAVVDGDTGKVTVLLFLNQSTTSKGQPDPKIDGSRVRAVLESVDSRWLISEVTPL